MGTTAQVVDAEKPDTQVADVEVAQTDDKGADSQPFLVVNDRTKYATQEDAIRGYSEAQAAITRLSPLEKTIKAFGLESADDLKEVLEDYAVRISMKKETPQPEKTTMTAKTESTDEVLSPEDEKALKWLEKSLKRLGVTPDKIAETVKAEREALSQRIEQIEARSAASDQQRDADAIQDGQSVLSELLEKDGIKVEGEDRERVEEFIATIIMRGAERLNAKGEKVWVKDSLADRFFNQGPKSRRAVMDETYKEFKRLFITPSKAAAATKIQTNADKKGVLPARNAATEKTAATKTAPKTMDDAHNSAINRFRKLSKESGIELGPSWDRE